MAFDITKIHTGCMRIWTGATAAASGAPPTYATHVNGVPNQGTPTEIGLTEGDCVFTYQLKKTEIMAEQSLLPVDMFADSETATLSFSMQEMNANAMKMAFDSSVGYDPTGGDAFYFGNGTAVMAPMKTCLFFSSLRRDNTAKFFVGQLYNVYSKDGMNFVASRTKKNTVKVTFVALADLTRTAKDQAGYIRRET